MRRGRFALTLCAVLGLAAGSVGLSSCGGGGGGSPAPLATIAPPKGVAQQTSRQDTGTPLTGVQITLHNSTDRGTTLTMTVEPEDADWGDVMPEIEPYNAGSLQNFQKLGNTFNYRFDCASGYNGDATITMVVTDLHGGQVEESVSFTCSSISPPPATIAPPEGVARQTSRQDMDTGTPLTGVQITLGSSTGRRTNLTLTVEPVGADWGGIVPEIEPYNAGSLRYFQNLGDNFYHRFECASGYNGDATITMVVTDLHGGRAEESVTFTCT